MNKEYISVYELSKYIKSNFDNDIYLRNVYLKCHPLNNKSTDK